MTAGPAAPDAAHVAEDFFGDGDRAIGFNRAWFNLIRAHRKFYPRLTKLLKAEGLRDPVWYEILLNLEQAGPQGRPMGDLEQVLFVPQYALSRHVARMEEEGFLARRLVSDGRRRNVLALTEKGIRAHTRIWPRYQEAFRAEMAAHLSVEEAYLLAFLLTRLLP